MRCPDCSKFVSLETQDPCCDTIEVEFSKDGETDGTFTITAQGTTDRNCADCGTLMKQVSWDAETILEIGDVEGFEDLPEKRRAELIAALDDGTATVEVSDQGTSAEESGGGRYQKNMITSTVEYFLEIKHGDLKLTATGNLSTENAASEFEEQC